ncbi:MAG: MATE family efflux transporter [Firmicutes bacterium]|nr:MATE family efflux transporter [Bacillota bacterium]
MEIENSFFGTEKVWKILFKLAPPVMLAQLVQAMYNIVDSYFVGQISNDGLNALSVIFPLQLLIMALGIGTGVGVNTVMARMYGQQNPRAAEEVAGTGTLLAVCSWAVFAFLSFVFMGFYADISAESQEVSRLAVTYGNIVCVGSLGMFLESCWTKIHQARGNMKRPMVAQVSGALVNIVLDFVLIFGVGDFIPAMGVAGAAIASVIGQFVAAFIVFPGGSGKLPTIGKRKFANADADGSLESVASYIKQIYRAGIPSIVMQALYTVYIMGLNLILVSFSDAAVTALGLYYKLQTFFFIPIFGFETCIVPVISYNYAIGSTARCRKILWDSCVFGMVFMLVGIVGFEFFPCQLIGLFSDDSLVMEIGVTAFRRIGLSFLPAVFSLLIPVFFQALEMGKESLAVTLLRQIVLLVPVAWALSFAGLDYVWFTFPISEILTCVLGLILYIRLYRKWEM